MKAPTVSQAGEMCNGPIASNEFDPTNGFKTFLKPNQIVVVVVGESVENAAKSPHDKDF
ncbi:MAG: hypothetical protein ACON4T_05345 [Synechococcus sp.]